MAQRTGTIYVEHGFRRYVRGVGIYARDRWCAELTVEGKRFRCRSASRRCAEAWLEDMLDRYPTYTTGGGRKKGKTLKTQGYGNEKD